jgi:hypothetical protein
VGQKIYAECKKMDKTTLLERSVNIDPADISRSTILDQAIDTMESQRIQALEEKKNNKTNNHMKIVEV